MLRHINYFQYSTYLYCRIPRIECEKCGVLQIKVPWAREKSNFTLRMEAHILELSKRMPVLQIGKLLGENDTKLWRVINHYTDNARSKEDLSDVCVVGIDETSCKKGHEYITLVVDIKDSKVIFAVKEKTLRLLPVLAKICKIIMETKATLNQYVATCLPHISVEFLKNFQMQKLHSIDFM
ncbi:helix-turn-helix domain-containing protein [Methanosarcina vacuolata]|uniref:helix-turn-helix domain-containing protein n=1 Tax=Methanosarcina vacuolata TaxID=2215 RepID=UPI00373AEA1B